MAVSFKFDPEVLIGPDTLSMAGTVASRHGARVMIAADSELDSQHVSRLKEILIDSGMDAIVFDGIEASSSVEMAENIVELCLAAHCDAIIGFGCHKTQIIARMAAIMTPMRISAFGLLDGRIFHNKILPLISIPTEGMCAFSKTNTFLAVDPRSRLIKSVQSPSELYSAVIVDNTLFKIFSDNNAFPFILEGFLSAMEAYCSTKANFFSDALLERALSFYAKLIRGGADNLSAETFAQAGFLTAVGTSSSSPGIGAALSIAISARTQISRSLCSAALLPVISERLAP